MLLLGSSAALLLLAFGCYGATQEKDILAMLKSSEAAWNQGDLPAFVSCFEDSPTTTKIDNQGVWHGDSAVILAHYREFYDTREKMGRLAFSEINVRPLADGLAVVNGKWSLESSQGDGTGLFTAVVHKTQPGWKIIHDQSNWVTTSPR
jgi:uncharacterized protein (TIGR02246 family)